MAVDSRCASNHLRFEEDGAHKTMHELHVSVIWGSNRRTTGLVNE
jgi:hypothetical protein